MPAPSPDTPDDLDALRAGLLLEETLRGHRFRLRTRWGLFAPRGVDPGTRLLVEHLPVEPDDRCLDLGCGYGPIALVMARLAPEGSVLAVDRDVVAVETTRENAAAHGLANVEALLSDGLRDVPGERRFDLVASNLPAKVGREMLTLLVADAHARLAPGGRLCVVTIDGLRPLVRRLCLARFGDWRKLKQGAAHTVSLAVKDGER